MFFSEESLTLSFFLFFFKEELISCCYSSYLMMLQSFVLISHAIVTGAVS